MIRCAAVVLLCLVGCGGPGGSSDAGVDAGSSPRLSALPDCGTVGDAGTAADVYANIVIPYGCASGGCHGGSPPNLFGVTDAASFRTEMLKASAQLPSMPRVTPGKVDESYLLYKLTGQHTAAGGSGARMPFDGPPYLTDAQLCSVLGWVGAGAP